MRVHFLLLMAVSGGLAGCEMYRENGHLHMGSAVLLDGPAGGYPRPERWERDPVVVQAVYLNTEPSAPLPASRRDRLPNDDDEAPPFDAAKARVSLASVDLSACRAAGAPRGYGHAMATFNPAGNISKVVIDVPSDLTSGAVTCIGNALGAATVPEFRGSLITVGTSWFVR